MTQPSQRREKPILFNGPMVRAILEGRKTQTRRIIKPQPGPFSEKDVEELTRCADGSRCTLSQRVNAAWQDGFINVECPFDVDLLWVRETIRHIATEPHPQFAPDREVSEYVADGSLTPADRWPWKRHVLPSIHCPRGLSRITLEVTGVRVERLQDISLDDCAAEGVEFPENARSVANFAHLWDSLATEETDWKANPWVWVVEFRRATP
jgi:hypothetical protein